MDPRSVQWYATQVLSVTLHSCCVVFCRFQQMEQLAHNALSNNNDVRRRATAAFQDLQQEPELLFQGLVGLLKQSAASEVTIVYFLLIRFISLSL